MANRFPLRGEIWYTKIPTDPPDKRRRPVVVVSTNARNNHARANTVLVIPLSTSVHKDNVPTHLHLEPGETDLDERMVAKAEDISVIRKESLEPPRRQQRSLSDLQICKLAQMVVVAMACISAAKIVPSEAKFLTFLLCGIMCLAQANMWTNP